MKICLIGYADSIHTQRWVEYFCNNSKNEVHILTIFPATKPIKGATIHNLSTNRTLTDRTSSALSHLSSKRSIPRWRLLLKPTAIMVRKNRFGNSLMYAREYYCNWGLLPFRILRYKNRVRSIIEKIKPDLVHGYSLVYGGNIAGLIGYRPLVVSILGTEFVYFAKKYPIYRWLMKKALSQTDLLLPDNTRDKYLAEVYGFSPSKPSYVMPATGGLKLEEFPLYKKNKSIRKKLGINSDTNLIISIRGFKTFHVNTKTLIRTIPQIIKRFPNSLFVIDGGYQSTSYFYLKRIAQHLKVEKYIRFTNRLNRQDLADYLSASDLMVSATIYDGMPISMLEGMAFGLIPIMSIHSSIQDWIRDDWNGYFFNPRDPENLAKVVIKALKNKDNFEVMRKRNWDILTERADYYKNIKIAEKLYNKVIKDYKNND